MDESEAEVALDFRDAPHSSSPARFRATTSANCRPKWSSISFARLPSPWARHCTSRSAARTRITWSKRASRPWAARCGRLSGATARTCPQPRGYCDAASRLSTAAERISPRYCSAFERLGVAAELTTDADVIGAAGHVLLPGVGAARDAMTRLDDAKLVDVIRGAHAAGARHLPGYAIAV